MSVRFRVDEVPKADMLKHIPSPSYSIDISHDHMLASFERSVSAHQSKLKKGLLDARGDSRGSRELRSAAMGLVYSTTPAQAYPLPCEGGSVKADCEA